MHMCGDPGSGVCVALKTQLGEPVGVTQQGEHGVADEVDGGLVPGDEQQEHHGHHLGLGEVGAVVGGGEQPGEHVLTGLGSAVGDEGAQVGVHVGGRGQDCLPSLGAGEQDGVRPVPELVPVGDGDAEITVIGRGNANVESRSTGPVVGIAAISSSAICSIRGTSAVTERGVKAFATSFGAGCARVGRC